MPLLRLAAVLLLLASGADADQREVAGEELATLLSGNSIEGLWGDRVYVQFFAANGRTGYRPEGGAVDWGTWRIAADGRYCSVWRGGAESCYPVIETADGLFWEVESSGALYPFSVVTGNLLEP